MKAKPLLLNVGLMVLSVGICLVATEAALRIWKHDIAFQPDPQLIRSLRPNVTREIWSYDTPDVLATKRPTATPADLGPDYTNNVGLRMKENIVQGSDERRILLLGDSFVEAEQVPDAKRFYALTQAGLDDARRGGPRWRIVNAGIQNGAPSQYVLQLRRYLSEFHPAVVIVFLAPNDARDDFDFEDRFGYEFDGRGIPQRPVTRARLWVFQKWWTLRYVDVVAQRRSRWLEERIWPERLDPRTAPSWVRTLCTDDTADRQWFLNKTGAYVAELKRMAEAAGAQFAIVLTNYMWTFPDEPSFAPALDQPYQSGCAQTHGDAYRAFIHAFLDDRAIAFDDPYETLLSAKRRTPSEKLWNFYDYHYSPAGHRLIAVELLRFLREHFAIPP